MFKPIFSLIVIILSVIFAFFYVVPEYNRAQEYRVDLAKLIQISKNADEIEILIGQTEETLKSVDATGLSRFAVFLPETSDPVRLANNLQRMGLANGVVLQNIKVEESVAGIQKSANENKTEQGNWATKSGTVSGDKKYATTKANFTFTATYEAFGKLLFDVEKSLGLINITALSFAPVPVVVDTKNTKQVESPPLYQYVVAVETYSLK